MSWLEAIVLGIVQGLTEFLPISSTGHVRVVPELFGWDDPGAAFSAVIQLGTMAAVLGSLVGDALGGTYAWRAGVYAALLAYLVAGAVVLFVKVARHETQRLSGRRLALWVASLWMWPLLLLGRSRG